MYESLDMAKSFRCSIHFWQLPSPWFILSRAPFGLNIPHQPGFLQHAKEAKEEEEVPKIMPDINER